MCNGIETCNVTSGVCEQGPALDCDDNDLCTTDTCDSVTGCIHTPMDCIYYQACDSLTGTCEEFDNINPCIAVLDEAYATGEYAKVIDESWSNFRSYYPKRPFCLLRPLNLNPCREFSFYIPPDFLSDPLATFAIVNRDEGDPALASDWFAACN